MLCSFSYQEKKDEILKADDETPTDIESTEPSSLDQLIRRLLAVLTEHKGMT